MNTQGIIKLFNLTLCKKNVLIIIRSSYQLNEKYTYIIKQDCRDLGTAVKGTISQVIFWSMLPVRRKGRLKQGYHMYQHLAA